MSTRVGVGERDMVAVVVAVHVGAHVAEAVGESEGVRVRLCVGDSDGDGVALGVGVADRVTEGVALHDGDTAKSEYMPRGASERATNKVTGGSSVSAKA